ncbi:hypothetical protein Glove_67g110 [Diversispora epigaea]|uniref:Uncharacterized protein n=1 Tax=Diversispora epigaea TaxID=1348612 RepID=A0A397JJE3_9GLOM|nr:hypothetical protein Glove_67g110 [Diversispora epigaea]
MVTSLKKDIATKRREKNHRDKENYKKRYRKLQKEEDIESYRKLQKRREKIIRGYKKREEEERGKARMEKKCSHGLRFERLNIYRIADRYNVKNFCLKR